MDYRLRQLKRNATASDDVESWRNYALALERITAGEALEPEFSYRYSGLECPSCEQDWTEDGSVCATLTIEGTCVNADVALQLDTSGLLMDTPDDAIAKGFAVFIQCGNCWAEMEEWQVHES